MSGADKAGRPGTPGDHSDPAINLAERYDQAISAFNRGDYGHALQLLSQITKVKPNFDDRENLRLRVAAALDQQQRDLVFNKTKTQAEAALQQSRWDDIANIVTAMHGRLGAENLTLDDDQRLEVNQWGIKASRRGGSVRSKRPNRAKQRLSPPSAPLAPPPGTGPRPAPKPPSVLRRNQELLIGCAVVTTLAFVLATVVFLGASRSSEVATDVSVDSGGDLVPVEATDGSVQPEPIQSESSASIDLLRATWAEERRAIVDELNVTDQVGISEDLTLTGRQGVSVDLSTCPADWEDTQGIRDGVIHLALTAPQSGGLAAYGQFSAGMGAYFDQVNEQGGIGPDGLLVELTTYDDGFNAAKTEEIVDGLLSGDQPFAITTLGTPNTLAVYDALNDACVPQPTVQSSHPAWSDPENHPWTTGLEMSYATEAWLWGSWIDENFPSSVSVAALVMDNDFGRVYEQAFTDFVEIFVGIENVDIVRHDAAASSLTDEMAVVAALDPTVFISMTAGNPCLLVIEAAAETGLDETAEALITPSACTDIPAFLAPAAEAADGWLTFGGGLDDFSEPTARPGAFAEYVVESLTNAGLNPNDLAAAEGFGFRGWTLHQILEVAANLEGGLTRSNLLVAQWGLRGMTHPMVFNGIQFGTSGKRSPSFIEGSDISRFNAGSQSWDLEGVIDRKGKLLPCRWDPEFGCT